MYNDYNLFFSLLIVNFYFRLEILVNLKDLPLINRLYGPINQHVNSYFLRSWVLFSKVQSNLLNYEQ
jgi:hypothetical protein